MYLPTDQSLRELFCDTKTIAIIGAKDVPGQDVDRVGRYLLAQGYTVIPVHPKRRVVWGLDARPSVEMVDQADMVVLFRAPQYCPGHAKEVLAMKSRPRCFWMQEGIASPEARRILQPEGIFVMEDRCVMVEHRRLLGSK